MLDQYVNFGFGSVTERPVSGVSGNTLAMAPDDADAFPDPGLGAYNVTVFPNGQIPRKTNAEIVRFIARDTSFTGKVIFTILRQQEGSAARDIKVNDQLMLGVTRKMIDELARRDEVLMSANNLSDLTTVSVARNNLGLAIGTDVQAYHPNLQQVANLGDPDADRLVFWDDSAGQFTYLTPGTGLTITGTTLNASATGSGQTVAYTITKTGHGFNVGDVLRSDGTANGYALAQADSVGNAEVVGIVTAVPDADNFTLTLQGIVTANVPVATAGSVLFLSPTSPGALTATEPTAIGQISKPVAIVLQSGTKMIFNNFRGMNIDSTGGGGGDGGGTWGSIIGTLSAQTDLQTALDAKLNKSGGTMSGGLVFSGTTHAGVTLNSLTTTQRNALTATNGMIIYNSTAARVERYENSIWKNALLNGYVTVGTSNADYITTGTADQTQINQAITFMSSLGGGIVKLKEGTTFTLNSSLAPASNVYIEGGGWSTILKTADNTGMHLFNFLTVNNVGVRNLQIDGNKANNATQTGHLIRIQETTNLYLENLYVHDSGLHGIISAAGAFDNNNLWILNCRTENNGVSANGSGVYLNGTQRAFISNLTTTGNQLDGLQWKTSDFIQVDNITSYSNGRFGIYAIDGHANIHNVNLYSNTNIGLHVEASVGGGSTVNVENGKIYNSGQDGIRITTSDHCNFSNVRSFNNGQGGGTYAGIRLIASNIGDTCNYHNFTNCDFYDDQVSKTQTFGIWCSGSGTIDFNVFNTVKAYGNSSTQFRKDTFAGSNIVQNVYGNNPEIFSNIGNVGGSKTFDRTNAIFQAATMTANLTVALTTGTNGGDLLTLSLRQDGTGGRTITWPANAVMSGNTIISTTPNAYDLFTFRWNSSTARWHEVSRSIGDAATIMSTGSYANPSWITSLAASKLTGQVAVANGGTGAATLTGILKGNGTSAITGSATTSDLPEGTNLYYTDARVRLNRLDQMTAPTASVSFNSQKITGLLDPTAAQDGATKAYVDSTTQGLYPRGNARVGTVAALPAHTRSGNVLTASANGALPTIDGVTLILNDVILVKDEGSGTSLENGLYFVSAVGDVSNPWTLTRTTNADSSAEVISGIYTIITEGNTLLGSTWFLSTPNTITLNTTALTFVQLGSPTDVQAGAGLTKTGSTLDAIGTTNRIIVNADSIDISASYIGQTSITTLGTITAGTWQGNTIAVANGGTGAITAAAARTNLGLGTIATQDANNVTLTGGSITGITDLTIADGGTGASSASGARTNLGLGTIATQDATAVSIIGGSITGITDLAVADGGTGASDSATARTNLGLSTMATQSAASVTITGGTITGITDLAITDGGTGASSALTAFNNLSPLTTQGDILYRNATDNTRLPKGTANQMLRMNSGATAPEWYTGANRNLVLLGSDVASTASTSFQDITGMSFAVTSGVNYRFYAIIPYATSVATIGIRVSMTAPATSILAYTTRTSPGVAAGTAGGSTDQEWQNWQVATDSGTVSLQSLSTASNLIVLEGFIRPSASGTVQLRFAPETATASGVVIKAGASLEWW
jgi:hypothetical protein